MENFGLLTGRSSRSSWWEKSRRQCAENPGKVADKRACQFNWQGRGEKEFVDLALNTALRSQFCQAIQLAGQGREEGVCGPCPKHSTKK